MAIPAAGELTVKIGSQTLGTFNTAGAKSTTFAPSVDYAIGTNLNFIGSDSVPATAFSVDNVYLDLADGYSEEQSCSQCYKLREIYPCTILLKAANDDDAFGLNYSGFTTFYQNVRLLARVWKPLYPEERVNFRNSTGRDKIQYFDSQKNYTFSIEQMPEYMHNAIRALLGHDNVSIIDADGVETFYEKNEGDYDPVWRNSSLLAPVEVEITPIDDICRNQKCG